MDARAFFCPRSLARLAPVAFLLAAPVLRAQTPAAPAAAPAAAKAYSGHGEGSVSPEVLAKFAPPAIPSSVSSRIQALLDVRSPGTGFVSSDGKRLFFSWTVTGTRQVWRLDGPQRFPVQLTGGEDRTVADFISPDGSFLLISRDHGGDEYPGLYWQAPEGGPLHLIQRLPHVQTIPQFISDDSRYVYYRANDVKPDSYAIYRWEKGTGVKEKVFGEDGLWNVADHRPDGRLLLIKELGSAVTEIYEWNPATKALTPIIGQGEKEEYDAAYGAADGEVLVLTPKLGEYRRLYRWRSGKLDAVTPELKYDVSSFFIDDTRSRILYTVNEEGYSRLHGLDARSFKPLPLPKLPEADGVFPNRFTHNGQFSTVAVDTGTAPVIGYVVDWKSLKATQWQLPSAPEVNLSLFVRAKLEYYPARDGTRIPMLVRRPLKCTEPCPVVVEFHGGPEGQSTPGFSPIAQFFVEAGFVFVEPNVRGSDGYGKSWFHADDGPKRLNIITDIEDCSKYIRKAWAVGGQAPKVGIFGGSYGGYSSLIGMTMFAGAYDAGVDIVGISNLLTFLNNTAPYRRALRVNEYGDPEKDKEALIKLSPMTYLDRVKAPLLVIAGANDPRVPVGEGVQIHDALQAKGVKSQLIIFPDEGHGAAKRANQVVEFGASLDFFEQTLKPKQAEPHAER
jgi:dipeptidyl aminopeptidase/acylaminoacyl peptidase